MYTAEILLDIHDRAHQNLAGLLAHCRRLDDESLNRQEEELR